MPNLQSRIKKAVVKAAGSSFWKKFVLTSSDIITTAADLTGVANGDLIIEQVILATDATGLATGTNFQLNISGETYGEDKPIVETVANLGANITRSLIHGSDDRTNDRFLSVTGTPFILEAGAKLQYSSTVADCTGAGKVAILIKFTRLSDNADIQSAV